MEDNLKIYLNKRLYIFKDVEEMKYDKVFQNCLYLFFQKHNEIWLITHYIHIDTYDFTLISNAKIVNNAELQYIVKGKIYNYKLFTNKKSSYISETTFNNITTQGVVFYFANYSHLSIRKKSEYKSFRLDLKYSKKQK